MKKININGLSNLGPYSQAVQVQNTFYFSGQLGIDFTTNQMAPDVKTQTKQALQNIKLLLDENDLKIDNIAKATIFVNDINDFDAINQVYAEFMNGHAPARSLVQVAAIPKNALVEIEVIVVVENA